MVADVSSLVRTTKGYKEDQQVVNDSGKSAVLITRDLLGGSTTIDSKELDLDLQVPTGWEKRLDLKGPFGYCDEKGKERRVISLNGERGKERRMASHQISPSLVRNKKGLMVRISSPTPSVPLPLFYIQTQSGKVYLQKRNSPSSSCSSDHRSQQSSGTVPTLQDLNFPPSSKQPLNFFECTSLDLKLVSSPSTYQSVCTLDKVKSALERAEKETIKKRCVFMSNSSSPPSDTSSSTRETKMEYDEKSSSSFAAGCPSCLLYVLISKNDPKCPRCHTFIPSPIPMKKPRIDLNISI